MSLKNWTVAEALAKVQEIRKEAKPHKAFLKQLELYERCGSPFQGDRPTCFETRMHFLQEARTDRELKGKLPSGLLAPDPEEAFIVTVYRPGAPPKQGLIPGCGGHWCCVQCERRLSMNLSVIAHDPLCWEDDEDGTAAAIEPACASGDPTAELCHSFFVEPSQWMQGLSSSAGTIHCPNCRGAVGSWSAPTGTPLRLCRGFISS